MKKKRLFWRICLASLAGLAIACNLPSGHQQADNSFSNHQKPSEMKDLKVAFPQAPQVLTTEAPNKNPLACLLNSRELAARKKKLQKEVLSQVQTITELEDGYRFSFKDRKGMDKKIFDFILTEKACCPFFKFEVAIDPDSKGIDLSLGGSKEVKEFIKEEFF